MPRLSWNDATGYNSTPEEIIELAGVVEKHGGIYATHMRNEMEHVLDAVDEAIRIGMESGCRVQISHVMIEEDVRTFLPHPRLMVGSDGPTWSHPRGSGTFPRIWGHYGRDLGLLIIRSNHESGIAPFACLDIDVHALVKNLRDSGRVTISGRLEKVPGQFILIPGHMPGYLIVCLLKETVQLLQDMLN